MSDPDSPDFVAEQLRKLAAQKAARDAREAAERARREAQQQTNRNR